MIEVHADYREYTYEDGTFVPYGDFVGVEVEGDNGKTEILLQEDIRLAA